LKAPYHVLCKTFRQTVITFYILQIELVLMGMIYATLLETEREKSEFVASEHVYLQ